MPVRKLRDNLGYYEQWGQHGKKYRFNTIIGEREARRRADIQSMAAYANGYRGDGIFGNIARAVLPKAIYNRLPFQRTQAPPQLRNVMDKFNGVNIKQVFVCRTPLQNHIRTLLGLITSGQSEQAKKDLNYDFIFHLFMVIQLENDTFIRVDKNEVVHVRVGQGLEGQSKPAGKPNPPADLRNFFFRGQKLVGPNAYWIYSAHSTNCQRFVLDTLMANNMLNPGLEEFIKQDAAKVLPPGVGRTLADFATDLAGRANRVIYGENVVRRKRRHQNRFIGRGIFSAE